MNHVNTYLSEEVLHVGIKSYVIEVTVDPGQDVILPCQTANSNIKAVKWTRSDLEPEYVLLYRDGHLNTDDQHSSFKDRVELVDRDLKVGDVSLILKNVRSIDTGTYECGVITDGSDPIRIIRLQVPDVIVVAVPGDDVTLPCLAPDSSIRVVKWSRPDLEPDTVLFYRDGHLNTDDQHSSFQGRVDLLERDLKDGDASLILKNVNKHDAGTYKCRVMASDTDPIRTIRLQVTVTYPMSKVLAVPTLVWVVGLIILSTVPATASSVSTMSFVAAAFSGPHSICCPPADRRFKHGFLTYSLVFPPDAARLPDVNVVRVPGQDVILPCEAADSSIRVVKWSRPDLKPDIVLVYRDGHLDTDDQHPSFKDRVELVDRELKDGNVSLILKNLNINDTGTYECRVKTGDSGHTKRDTDPDQIRTVYLQVPDVIVVAVPGDDVILPCQAPDSSIRVVKWSRPDLDPDIVLLYSNGDLDTTHQHPSFKGRVELVDRELNDGDVSLILKNVNKHDAGTYECGVKTGDTDPIRPIRTIRLHVPDLNVVKVPGDDVILPCQAAKSNISVVKWSRPDLKPDTVLFYGDGHLNTTDQHPSFRDRVELVDRELKDRDASLILKHVNQHDAGIYNCRVMASDTDPITTIYLQVPDVIVVAVPGDEVILPCQTADPSISVAKWTRPDLEPDTVLYRNGHLNTYDQNPSFKDRVELVDRDLKDGDVSLILKNVSRIDTGIYACRVKTGDTDQIRLIRTIRTVCLQVSDLIVVAVPGDDVILPRRAADSSIRVVKWSRADLKPDIVLLYSDGHLETYNQHPSFKDRVDLVDRDLKDGNVSLILKNVSRHDAGTYKCGVKTSDSTQDTNSDTIRIIRIIRLQVKGSGDRISSPVGLLFGLAAGGLVLVAAAVVGVDI
ncbi:polymeric immunoglobulin receptor-like [Perca fluviatilis]|uniref:polymeric immunoglobulin receptor-like n=1 Tax=Perca fluviatilis TaxID=8168 RepID=UPI00196647D0|nr:polymeric immunoglobulin receptor-like [Perca fluviatilis]